MRKLRIDVWSDIACPWCYIGKRHLERALESFEHAAQVDVTWHAFELDPDAPALRDDGLTVVQRLAKKYRLPTAQAEVMIARVVDAGARVGIDMRYDVMRSGNTFDAHRLLHWALDTGKQSALKERIMRAYFTDGVAPSDRAVLATLAGDVGLSATDARAMLDSDRFTTEVRADEAQAAELGISGVPFFVLGGKIGVSGAQPIETMAKVLAKAWGDVSEPIGADGAACGIDGC